MMLADESGFASGSPLAYMEPPEATTVYFVEPRRVLIIGEEIDPYGCVVVVTA